MGKIARKVKKGSPGISTASLPDIVFMLLFFFMVSTSMREVDLKVKMNMPEATEVAKIENKTLVGYIYIGEPLPAYKKELGSEPRIQIDDAFCTLSQIATFVDAKRKSLPEPDQAKLTISIKADEATQMGIITDVKEELKKANALKINYATRRDFK